MTSREELKRNLRGPLDAMIRWVLRESVGDVRPPAGVWARINERVAREASIKAVAWREGFQLVASAVAISLLGPAAGGGAGIPYRGLGYGAWGGEYPCLADEYGILLRRLAVL